MKRFAGAFLFYVLPIAMICLCSAQAVSSSHVHFRAQVLSICNFALLISCIVCIKQYFKPGDTVRIPFHVVNLICIIIFYSLSIPFLINNIPYYEHSEQLTPASVLGNFFLSTDPGSVMQWLIIATAVINILYIIKYREDFLNADIPEEHNGQIITIEEGTTT